MLDINLIRNNPEKVRKALLKKNWDADFTILIKKFDEKKDLIKKNDELKAEKNKLSAQVPVLKKEGKSTEKIFETVKNINSEIEHYDSIIKQLNDEIFEYVSALPNIPDDDLADGGKENNKTIRTFGKKPQFDFEAKNHIDLCENLGLIDYSRAAKLSGKGTWMYTGDGARLEWALLNFFIGEHLKDEYKFILPPHILNYESGFVAGQFPKFEKDVFWLEGTEPKKFILPTAETALVNFHRDEILNENELPKKYFAYTPCYRCEAGSYRTEERGMIRGYQFNKVEIFQYTTPEKSDEAFEELVKKAESLAEKLGLHFQTSKLAAADCSHSMSRTYDIEVWIPSMEIYKEVSSASNARDYQARRGNIRFKDNKTGKSRFCHILNASGLATARIIPAIVEQFQNKDGSVNIPDVLVPFMNGQNVLSPIKK
ncbi:MAG: serine--tRNA ligase [Clostridia bacterium]|nr:serine--tRNA ligase [Clostridia bacterium]MDD4685689.1 serine--tRNA ligase [Clostridia bacterium]